jgi:hypothetical protein
MRNMSRWIICAILFLVCLLILNYLNKGLKEGYRSNFPCVQPSWLFNNSNNIPPLYQYKYIH